MAAVTDQQNPASLRWAIRLLAVEATAVGVIALVLGYRGIVAEPTSVGDAMAVAGFVAVVAAALAGLSVALARRKPRARAPAIVLQLMTVMFAYVLLTSGLPAAGVPLGLLGLTIGTLLLAPTTGEALTGSAAR